MYNLKGEWLTISQPLGRTLSIDPSTGLTARLAQSLPFMNCSAIANCVEPAADLPRVPLAESHCGGTTTRLPVKGAGPRLTQKA